MSEPRIASTESFNEFAIDKARRDVNAFIELCFVDVESEKHFKQAPFHKEWQANLTNYNYNVICAPRGHGLTLQLIARVIYELGQNTALRIKIICSTNLKANDILEFLYDTLNSPLIKQVFPLFEVTDYDTNNIRIKGSRTRDYSIECVAWDTKSGVGGRCDWLIAESIVDAGLILGKEPPTTQDQIKAFYNTWGPLVANDGKITVAGTPYKKGDIYDELKKLKRNPWHVFWEPAIKNTVALWPEQWSVDKLLNKKVLLGQRAFNQFFMLKYED